MQVANMRSTLNWCMLVLFTTGAAMMTSQASAEPLVSDIKDDEEVVFFRTSAWLDETGEHWVVPIHGWVYEPEDSTARKALFAKILKKKFDLEPDAATQANFDYRLNLMIADNERGKRVVARMGGEDYRLPKSAPNGHFRTLIEVPVDSLNGPVAKLLAVAPDGRKFTGEVRLVGTTGVSVVSDIDDTVKISKVTDRQGLLEHTFLLDFLAAPGMGDTYAAWSEQDVSFHFVSSSPWQLYPALAGFLDTEGFPWAEFSLKSVRFRDRTLFNLFKKGTETKPAAIKAILDRYPQRRFVLVGDSGEQDPEVYAALIRERPEQIQRVYIRNVTGEEPDNERFAELFDGIDAERWQLFDSPLTLSLP